MFIFIYVSKNKSYFSLRTRLINRKNIHLKILESPIWKHFDKNMATNKAKCNYCLKDIGCGDLTDSKWRYSKMYRHIEKMHKQIHEELIEEKKQFNINRDQQRDKIRRMFYCF